MVFPAGISFRRIPEPGILSTAVSLYLAAFGAAFIRGPDSFLCGVLAGCGSIAIGVWLGVWVTTRHFREAAALQRMQKSWEEEEDI